MIPDIEKKIQALNPEGQRAVLAFVEFLLSRQKEDNPDCIRTDREEENELIIPDIRIHADPLTGDLVHPHQHSKTEIAESGIILAEERIIEEKSQIDFTDINTRFPEKETGQESGKGRHPKMFDWM